LDKKKKRLPPLPPPRCGLLQTRKPPALLRTSRAPSNSLTGEETASGERERLRLHRIGSSSALFPRSSLERSGARGGESSLPQNRRPPEPTRPPAVLYDVLFPECINLRFLLAGQPFLSRPHRDKSPVRKMQMPPPPREA